MLMLRLHNAKWRLHQTPGKGRSTAERFAPLRGKNLDGSWKTVVKQLYPDGLCKVLAELMLDSVFLEGDDATTLAEGGSLRTLFSDRW